ncbi:MAG: hypothetical protein AAF288_06830 [Planctomycetota bacterium]
MAKPGITARIPWEDRWNAPTVEALLKDHKESHAKAFNSFLEGASKFEGVALSIAWHGEAWKWAIEFNLPHAGLGGKEADQMSMAYIVPRPETPEVAIPLAPSFLEVLPMRRINRFVREPIRSARQAVDVHWGLFTPSAQTEVDHLLDLFKRKHKWIALTHPLPSQA